MSELVVLEKQNVMTVFTEANAIDPILANIAKQAKSIVYDVGTAQGRKEIASTAYKVAQAKTYLDGLGKDLVDEMKELPKKVDASRKAMRDFLDNLKDEIRLPLTQWEEEQERIEAEKKAAIEAEALRVKVEADHELALLMNAEHDRQIEAQKQAIEQARIEREANIAKEAEQRAKAEAEAKAKAEVEEAERKVIAARVAQERAEQDKRDAEEKAARAIEDERLRVAQAEQAEKAAEAKREADLAHVKRINNEALTALVAQAKLNDDQAKLVVIAIAKALIPNVSIKY
jgi:colicin import membrane protein